ncbi:MAG: M20 family metallo-hydrolase [Verrucomicrobiota bacterium]
MSTSTTSPYDRAVARLEELARVSDHSDFLTRSFLSPANLKAARMVSAWMSELGMEVGHSVDGTVRGILAGNRSDEAPLLLGSHLDTVVDAGCYDGALGIAVAIAALEDLRDSGTSLPFPVHVLGFSDEEGSRFHTTYLGSRSVTGELDTETLGKTDETGRDLASVLRDEGWHEGATPIRYSKSEPRGYVEVHIEQGPVLETEDLAACGVSSIAGQSRLAITLKGRADHAGTTPMGQRRDALAGASECVLAAEKLATQHAEAVATIGKLQVGPGVSNTIPQLAEFSVDLRHPDDAVRDAIREQMRNEFEEISHRRALDLNFQIVQENPAIRCNPELTDQLAEVAEEVTGRRLCLASGAGHDAVTLATIAPVAMLFVRCREGLSHHPDEYASPHDVAVAGRILAKFLKRLAS